MSQLNILDLIKDAPVEWMELGEVTNVLRGKRLTKNQLSDEYQTPVYHGGLEPLGFYSEANRPSETAMVINVGASAGTVGYSNKPFWSSDGCFAIKHSNILLSKFLYYFLSHQEFYLKSRVRVAGIPTLDSLVLEKLQIPILPLTIQQEVVRILDAMTKLTSELTSERNAREKQYNYYRDQLFSFSEGEIKWKKLSELATLRRGRVISKTYLAENIGEYPVYSSQTVNNGEIGSIDTFDFNGEFISWITDGANAGTAFYRKGKFSITNVCGLITIQDETILNYKFLYYWLTIEAKKHVYSGMGNPKLMSHQVEGIPIPVPTLTEQARIIAILDKFETLTTSLSEGLPHEIELRQKQYEYYREQLLNFPKKEPQEA